jgi:NifU-like protein involved in Fe-S cluster formation
MSNIPNITSKYASSVLDHFSNPRNVGTLNNKSGSVGTGLVGAPACGDVMKLQIEVENDIIKDAKLRTFGCGSVCWQRELLRVRLKIIKIRIKN